MADLSPPGDDPQRCGSGNGVAGQAFLDRGVQLMEEGDLEAAETAFRRADGFGVAAGAVRLGRLLENRGDLDGAEAAYRRADEHGDADGARELGWILQEQRDLDGAEAAYRRADERDSAEGARLLGVILHQRGDLEGAEAASRRADERGSADGARNLGIMLYQQGDLDGAEAAYRRADDRGLAEGAYNLGVILQQRGDPEAAEAAYRRADERGSAGGAYGLGVILQQRGDLEAAETAYRRADERGSAEGALGLGTLLRQRGDLDGAEAAYRRADDRGLAEGGYNLGVILQQRGDPDGAEAAYRRADERGSADGARSLGVMLYQRGDLDGAEAASRRADERGLAEGAYNLGVILQQRGDLEAAEAAYRRADERGSATGTRGLMRVLVENADREQADRVLHQAVMGSDIERAFNLAIGLGQALKDVNMPSAAEVPARRATELKQESSEALRLLAAILTMQGRCGDAEDAIRSALKIESVNHPTSDEVAPSAPQQDDHPPQASLSVVERRHKNHRQPLRSLVDLLAGVFSKSPPISDGDADTAIGALYALGDKLTMDFAKLIAGNEVSDFAAPEELFHRLTIEISPLLASGYAYKPRFGNYGSMRTSGPFTGPVTIEVHYTDDSVRLNRDGRTIVGRPRHVRMVADASPPYNLASSVDFTIIHGRPAPAVVQSSSVTEQPHDEPPWPSKADRPIGEDEPSVRGHCTSGDCQRARVGRTDFCLAHVDDADLSQALREHDGVIDARRMSITAVILEAMKEGPLVKPIWFDEASFDTPANFDGCLFLAPVSFEYASFNDVASFAGATFSQLTSFAGSRFLSQTSFERARFHGAALFDGGDFLSDVSFVDCTFHGGASFVGSRFHLLCSFNSCSFRTDVHSIFTTYFCGAVTFSGALFEYPPGFAPVLIKGVCTFDQAKFTSESLVTLQITCSAASFVDTEFLGGVDMLLSPCDVIMDGANFAKASLLTTSRAAQFPEAFELSRRDPWARVRLVSVRSARVGLLRLDDVDLRACHFDGAHGLDKTRIEGADVFAAPPGRWRVRRPVVAEEWSWRSYGRRGGPRLSSVGAGIRLIPPSGQGGWAQIPEECTAPSWLADPPGPIPRRRIVAIYRDLRKGREDNRDQLNAADFYYSEMEMRSERDHSSVLNAEKKRSWVERILLRVFWAISGYDVRPVRSVITLAIVVMGSAAVLTGMGYKQGTNFGHAAITSLSAVVAPFGPADWTLLNSTGQLVEIFLRVAGPILLALTALGIRARARR